MCQQLNNRGVLNCSETMVNAVRLEQFNGVSEAFCATGLSGMNSLLQAGITDPSEGVRKTWSCSSSRGLVAIH